MDGGAGDRTTKGKEGSELDCEWEDGFIGEDLHAKYWANGVDGDDVEDGDMTMVKVMMKVAKAKAKGWRRRKKSEE